MNDLLLQLWFYAEVVAAIVICRAANAYLSPSLRQAVMGLMSLLNQSLRPRLSRCELTSKTWGTRRGISSQRSRPVLRGNPHRFFLPAAAAGDAAR